MSELCLTSYITAQIRLFRTQAQAGLGRRYEKKKKQQKENRKTNLRKDVQIHLLITIKLGDGLVCTPTPPIQEKSRKEKPQIVSISRPWESMEGTLYMKGLHYDFRRFEKARNSIYTANMIYLLLDTN